ncbi:acyl carrier protein [Hymenobacter arcticus]
MAAVALASLVMGLDSVELLVRFEKYFEVDVPDSVAEQLATPSDVASWVSQFLGISLAHDSARRAAVAQQLKLLFGPLMPVATTQLADLLPNGEAWAHYAQLLVSQTSWQLPEIDWLRPPRARGWLNQLFNWVTSVEPPEPNSYSFADLIDWTLARNYEALLPKPWQSYYEVLQAVMGITSNSSGLDMSEIKSNSRFTSDLGID